MRRWLPAFVLALSISGAAYAATFDGVTLPDTATVGGQTLKLNGIGLREKYWLDIYVGALYLPETTKDAQKAITEDVPKRVVLHFIYSKVTKDQLTDAWKEDFANNPEAAKHQADVDKFLSWIPADGVVAGDELAYEYVPGTGTTVYTKGKAMGTIPGADFMQIIWNVWLGAHPPTEDLKKGMLGNG